jgi:dolichol-phosphate mannosyltransferase
MRISVVIPAYNEEGNIGRLVEETFAAEPSPQEVIIVDDAIGAEVKALFKSRPSLRYLRHGRRAGQSATLSTGVMAASAPVIATMDADGQNDPKDIMRLLVIYARNIYFIQLGKRANGAAEIV